MTYRQEVPYSTPDWTVRCTHVSFRLDTAKPFHAAIVRFPAPTRPRVSIHDGFEICVMLRGGADVHVGDGLSSGRPGDLWLIGMWEPHRWRITRRRTEQVSLIFLPEYIGDDVLRVSAWMRMFACAPAERPAVRSEAMRRSVLAIGRELRAEIEAKRCGWERGVRLGALRLLHLLEREWQPPRRLAGVATTEALPRHMSRIMPAIAAVHARPADRVRLSDAAAACGLSPAQFNRVFHQATGVSFGRFRLRSRLAYAANLVYSTDLCLETIAQRAGFTDASHLHRSFARSYGVTPGAYRAANR